MMRWMLGVTLLDRRRNSWLYEKLKLREVRSEAVKRKWLFAKKIATGEDTWAKKIVEWRPWAKTRGVGRPKPRWRDDLQYEQFLVKDRRQLREPTNISSNIP
ncbi:unnamed protein product [Caenorhabditis auriculariae]|uniref:Uncharacterized protein n=1 Tax=Caenorhabditis auriculariae TaxID=2777116 RepID=A0A8S1HN68_9PELO|nr:unnamed protein product [Caenorhabditis auriculariae]